VHAAFFTRPLGPSIEVIVLAAKTQMIGMLSQWHYPKQAADPHETHSHIIAIGLLCRAAKELTEQMELMHAYGRQLDPILVRRSLSRGVQERIENGDAASNRNGHWPAYPQVR
jgi:hypothetical protein